MVWVASSLGRASGTSRRATRCCPIDGSPNASSSSPIPRGAAVKAEILLPICVALLTSCAPPDPDQPPDPPDAIGDELMGFTTALGFPNCTVGHMYRDHELVQFQCFSTDGTYSHENRGTLSDQ